MRRHLIKLKTGLPLRFVPVAQRRSQIFSKRRAEPIFQKEVAEELGGGPFEKSGRICNDWLATAVETVVLVVRRL
jgi:hypothetical protein